MPVTRPPIQQHEAMRRTDRLRVLLVEDQSIVALATSTRLTREGYDTEIALSGEEAVDLVEREQKGDDPFRLILMDIDLGDGIDGVETARRILERHELPIVFLTGHTEPEYVSRVREVTRYGYVLKHSDELILRLSMEMAIDLFDAHQLSRRRQAEVEAIYDHAPVMMLLVNGAARVVKANRRAREHAGLAGTEAADTTLGRAVECVRAAGDAQACGRFPECGECGLRALVAATLDSGTEYEDVPVLIDVPVEGGRQAKRLIVSSAPLVQGEEHCALVSIIDLDELVDRSDNLGAS